MRGFYNDDNPRPPGSAPAPRGRKVRDDDIKSSEPGSLSLTDEGHRELSRYLDSRPYFDPNPNSNEEDIEDQIVKSRALAACEP